MTTICFATNNSNKLSEIHEILKDSYKIQSLQQLGCNDELPENQDTLEGNSLEKAEYIFRNFGVSVFADDTGLEVRSLDGAPGVYSARYAGPQRDSVDNMNLLLKNLEGKKNREARFRTVITLITENGIQQFEGIVEGYIAESLKGEGGFGYDPIFIPDGHETTFSEMSRTEKNRISHRGRAIEKLVTFLRSQS